MEKSMFLKRPNAEETEEDLLNLQEKWQSQKDRPAVQIQRVSRKDQEKTTQVKVSTESDKNFTACGRFEINLEELERENSIQILFPLQEKNVSWLSNDHTSDLEKQGFEQLDYSKEDGFPLPLDLSEYYIAKEDKVKKASSGRSFFATEFDLLHGKIDEATCSYKDISEEFVNIADFSAENEKYLLRLTSDKIQEMQKEIQQKLDPKTLQFLTNRHKKKVENPDTVPTKISKFKQAKLASSQSSKNSIKSEKIVNVNTEPIVDDLVKQLEVLDEFANREDEEKYNRLAADAIQLDFAAKCLKTIAPRQQRNAVRLFDSVKTNKSEDPLLEMARSHLEEIKKLYLEEVESDGHRSLQFAVRLNPLLDSCWMLRPIRTVLDATFKRKNDVLTTDDLEIIRLSLLWTLLLFYEKRSIFVQLSEAKDFYVYLNETFLLGSEVMADDISMQCITRLIDNFIFPAAKDGLLTIRLQNKIADLDAFAPFYDDLLRHYEYYSLGNVPFARSILIGAYLNSAVSDSLECRFAIWSPKSHIARQITVENSKAIDILAEIRAKGNEEAKVLEEQHYTLYVELLGAYAAAIRDEKVTRDRNQLMFTIASEELGRFILRHASFTEKATQFAMLVQIVRSTVKGKLDF